MNIAIRLFLILYLLFSASAARAEEEALPPVLDEATRALCNKIMLNIYYDILDAKEEYEELSEFDEQTLYENKYGIYTIIYRIGGQEDEKDPQARQDPYAFGVTIDGLDDQTFQPQRGSFNYGFPALRLKIAGYQKKHLLRSQYNIRPLLEHYGSLLANHQQKYLPLRLYLRTLKDIYRVQEDITFEVELKNVSKRHMIVKGLGQGTLFFLFNNEFWGTRPSSGATGGQDVVLKSGESLTIQFKGESFQRPREFDIFCTYRMSVDGVNPSGVLKVKVVE